MQVIQKNFIRITFFVVGIMILAFGISVMMLADLGLSTWDAVYVGAHDLFGVSVSFWVYLEAIFLIVLAAYISKEKPRYASFIVSLLLGVFIEVFFHMLESIVVTTLSMQFILYCFGICLIGIGIGVYLCAQYPPSPVDNLMLSIQKRKGYSIMISMTICEMLGLLIALILGGPMGIGTIVSVVAFGPCIQIFHHILLRFYRQCYPDGHGVHNAVDIIADDK